MARIHAISLPSPQQHTARRHALIYFICGNPGLIDFYAHFLDCLRGLLNEGDTAYHVYGRNLLGFVDDEHEPFGPGNPPWDLDRQIEGMYDHVASLRTETKDERPYDEVILMGHSVGTYISVEIFRRHLEDPSRAPHLHLRHGFLLFATLTHIAKSPSGLGVARLLQVPGFEANVHWLAKLPLALFSEGTLAWIVERVMGFTPAAAGVTARWLKSRDGVWQAIHMGLAEMRDIAEDTWEEELWEVAVRGGEGAAAADLPRFFIFYGKEDHWVANHLRDEFIEKRKGSARIIVDEGDLPHAFSVKEESSWAVARKVAAWVDEIEGGRQKA
ncbi:hypothetical protein B0I35DRAFT_453241 [Stachybotrys elegans]|uniref:Uncharacterized protein n=1 Tax=Stachybotrys elegans TaxID=80388 RepID=A0A8K0WME9_9HYPO|nr:hypothetical protein B0I35DRAFT_453241 [Stachybotrys elegans]